MSMFASIDTDIGSDLPLWAMQDDFVPGVSTVTRFMGGWTKAYAKQYHLVKQIRSQSIHCKTWKLKEILTAGTDYPFCGASVGLDSFSG